MSNQGDDYLWDRSGSDPRIEELEAALARYRYGGRRRRRRWWMAGTVAAGILAGALVFLLDRTLGPADAGPAWALEWLEGAGATDLGVGEWLRTGKDERVRITVADIGHVAVEPESNVRLVHSSAREHRLALERGKLHALVLAPPRLFVVDTPAATAVDLGCAYTLEVDASGDGLLEVLAGYVQLEAGRFVSFVPRGASCRMGKRTGPGLPYFADAPAAVREPTDLGAALAAARARDTLTLWHLLPRVEGDARARVLARLAEFEALPAGVSRESILRLDAEALGRWRDALRHLW
ncbi:MAG: FecR family protein [Planctomycetota bacterium]|jgi:hypothetical protein